jgi:hypothetical protein
MAADPLAMGQALCEALGLNAVDVLSIKLIVEAHSVPIVEVAAWPRDSDALAAVVSEYELNPLGTMDELNAIRGGDA